MPAIRGYLDLDRPLETRRHQIPYEPVEETVETQNHVQDRRATSSSFIQTPSGGTDLTMESVSCPESVAVHPGSGNAALSTRLSAIVRKPAPNDYVGGNGVAPPVTVLRHPKRAMDNPISYFSSKVSCFPHIEVYRSYLCAQPLSVPGKRFILFNDDDDDDDDDDNDT